MGKITLPDDYVQPPKGSCLVVMVGAIHRNEDGSGRFVPAFDYAVSQGRIDGKIALSMTSSKELVLD